jgi:hypothetical protein
MSTTRHWWLNLVGFQVVWYACVIGAGNQMIWPGCLAAIIFAAVTCLYGGKTRQDIKVISICLPIGFSLDSLLAYSNLLDYAQHWPSPQFAPAWILAMWLGFAATLNHSMKFLHNNPWLAAAFGFLGGPLAYYGAGRLFEAVSFEHSNSLLYTALAWGIAVPLIMWLFNRKQSAKAISP